MQTVCERKDVTVSSFQPMVAMMFCIILFGAGAAGLTHVLTTSQNPILVGCGAIIILLSILGCLGIMLRLAIDYYLIKKNVEA